jgi:hypothetical protein
VPRHLAFHVLPVAGNPVWRLGVEQLRLRWPLFTGVKVVSVATQGDCKLPLDPPEAVAAALPPDCEILTAPNDSKLREVVTWLPLWERVLGEAADDDAVLYAHAKGVTRPYDPGNACHWWASLQYSLVLDHWNAVAGQLATRPIVGAFKKVGGGFGAGGGGWHYSGTFYWVRAGDFRARPWRRVQQRWWGTESWPGLAYHPDEAGSLFLEGAVGSLDCYSPRFWAKTVRPRYAEWLTQNPPWWPWTGAEPPPSSGSPLTTGATRRKGGSSPRRATRSGRPGTRTTASGASGPPGLFGDGI